MNDTEIKDCHICRYKYLSLTNKPCITCGRWDNWKKQRFWSRK